ncbi:MAG TPA: hypothetical protein VF254_11895 [Gammaproteobacteria bacterium]
MHAILTRAIATACLLAVLPVAAAKPHYWVAELGAAFPAGRGSADDPASMLGLGAGWNLRPRGELRHELFVAKSVSDADTRTPENAYGVSIERLGWRARYRYPGRVRWFVLTGGVAWSNVETERPGFEAAGHALQAELGVGFGFGDAVDLTLRVDRSLDGARGETVGAWLTVAID